VDRQEWLRARKRGIGGSEVAAVLGLSPYKTPYDVWKDKTSDEIIEIPDNPNMEWGRRLEDAVAGAYTDRTNRKVQRVNDTIFSRDIPFLFASPDRLILADTKAKVEHPDMQGTGILEIKTTGAYAFKEWESSVPPYYWSQIQHYFFVRNLRWGAFAILVGGYDFQIVNVMRDDEYLLTQNAALTEFWTKFVQTNTTPPKNWRDYERAKKLIGDPVTASVDILSMCTDLSSIKAQLADLRTKQEEFEASIKEYMGEHDTLINDDNRVLATWKIIKGRTTVDAKRLQEEQPKIFEKYAKTGEPFRKFLPKQIGELEQ